MVMMEYMACGKPVVAAFNSGHKDVLREANAVLIHRHQMTPTHLSGRFVGNWSEPNLDETIEQLEWCYQNREPLNRLGAQAAADMANFTWKRVAEGLLDAVKKVRASPAFMS
jgi:glycosyltransferase involved in cell wall biosynthesis